MLYLSHFLQHKSSVSIDMNWQTWGGICAVAFTWNFARNCTVKYLRSEYKIESPGGNYYFRINFTNVIFKLGIYLMYLYEIIYYFLMTTFKLSLRETAYLDNRLLPKMFCEILLILYVQTWVQITSSFGSVCLH